MTSNHQHQLTKRRISNYKQLGRAGQELIKILFIFVFFLKEKIVGHIKTQILFTTVELKIPRVDVEQKTVDIQLFKSNRQLFMYRWAADTQYMSKTASDYRLQDHFKTFV